MAAAKANVYEMVTARIIAELEKGNIPCCMRKYWQWRVTKDIQQQGMLTLEEF